MNRDDDAAGLVSLAGLSEPGEAQPNANDDVGHPFAVAGEQRYRELRVVGTGGRGTVLMAHDARLGRDVALKRIGPGADEGAATARFAHEARITARLDHPGIVPIHDAGMTEDGRPYYTMRLIRGRSLAEIAAETTSSTARLTLTTAVTAACHAVGHAHRAGVVHRDLKPANIMVGELGETQVVDWGLAETTEIAARPTPYVGTPAYLSPESARGEGATPASDVWALGVVLFELVTGERRFLGTKDEILVALRTTNVPTASWPDAVPSELRAIADKAMMPSPTDRYVDAQAMASDLEAYRDGRRVGAHQYSTLELAGRLVSAWRWPLAVTGALVIATIGSLALTAYRTEQQRERAVTAETSTKNALAKAESSLGWALAASSVAALEARHDARAEVLAAHALTHGELPDARGVLAATRAGGHPELSRRMIIPGCEWVVAASRHVALCVAPTYVELWELDPLRRRWRRDLALSGAIDLDEHRLIGWSVKGDVIVLDAESGSELATHSGLAGGVAHVARNWERTRLGLHDRHTLMIVEANADKPVFVGRVCGDRTIDAIAVGNRSAWVVCEGGELASVTDDGRVQPIRDTGFGTIRRPASALGLSEPETDLAIGGVGGDVMMIDLRGCFSKACEGVDPITVFPAVTNHAITDVACLGNEVMVVADSGDAVHVRRGLGAELMRVPVHDGRAATFLEGGLAVGGAQWRLWEFPPSIAPRQLATRPGLTRGAISTDGTMIAIGDGAGTVVVWSTATGLVLATLVIGSGPIASIDFSPDGTQLIAATSSAALRLYETGGWTERAVATPPPRASYVGFPASGGSLALDGNQLIQWSDNATRHVTQGAWGTPITDAASDRTSVWWINTALEIWQLRADGPARIGTAVGAVAIAASRDGRSIATASPHRATLHGANDVTVDVRDAEILDLAISDDGRWLAAATTSGIIEVWSTATGQLIARLRGHRQRATWVGFRGAALWSAGWDGLVLRWDLHALDATADDLVRAVEHQWGLTLDAVLGVRGV